MKSEPMTHHSEPAREAAKPAPASEAVAMSRLLDQYDAQTDALMPILGEAAVWRRRVSADLRDLIPALAHPAPSASGGLEAAVRRAKYLLDRIEHDDGIGIGEFDTMLRMVIALASPAATRGEAVRAVSDNGKRWRIIPVDGDWEMQPVGHITAGQAETLCKRIEVALAPPTATTGFVGWQLRHEGFQWSKAVYTDDELAGLRLRFVTDQRRLYTHPAPAVESAQVKVKPLEWQARTSLHHCAETPFGSYSAYVDGGWKGPSSSGNAGGSFPEGRAAAEAQHQHDIRASLDLATDAEG